MNRSEQCFTVYDQAAKQFLTPFFAPTVEYAVRGFRTACEKDGHQFNAYPEDYVLYSIGEFFPETGAMSSHDPVKIAMALDFVVAPSNIKVDNA